MVVPEVKVPLVVVVTSSLDHTIQDVRCVWKTDLNVALLHRHVETEVIINLYLVIAALL